MISLKKVTVKGFRNIKSITIDLQDITCLLAPNNYGKSNVFSAIRFGYAFMKEPADKKILMMQNVTAIPINKAVAGKPFVFMIEGSLDDHRDFQYQYRFDWFKNNKETITDGYITGEFFKTRDVRKEKPKFSTIFQRESAEKAMYLPSPTGRCDKSLAIGAYELVVNKLFYYDDLFYHNDLDAVLKIKTIDIDSLTNPTNFFSTPQVRIGREGLQVQLDSQLGAYLYELKNKDSDGFDYLCSAITMLLPDIESIEPILIRKDNKADKDTPFMFPDRHEIWVKERYNNQQTQFQFLSTGSIKILYLLTCIVGAKKQDAQLLFVEELENSIHPNLMQSLLSVVKTFLGDTKLIFTSHSPNVAKYLSAPQLYVGLPSDKGVVDFRTIKPSKVKSVLAIAGAGDMSLGEYLFDLMLETESDASLIDFFFVPKKEA